MKKINDKSLFCIKILSICILSVIILFSLFYFGFSCGLKQKTRIVHVDFENTEISNEETWRYSFLKKEISDYIEQLSNELNIEPDLVVAILMRENPEFNENAQHQNDNGTFDLGMMQLNDKYIWSVFVPAYWDIKETEFNPMNWKHNLFLSMHHIQYLSESLKVQDDVIAAYNAGRGTVISGKIPASTRNYVAAVKNNYKLLKMECDKNE